MMAFLTGVLCRPIALDEHMDGRQDRTGCEAGEDRCDVCCGAPGGSERRRIVVHNGEVEVVRHNKRTRLEREQVEEEMVYERQFQEEQREYRRMEEKRRQEKIEGEDGAEQLQKQFERWSGRCIICHVRWRVSDEHRDWRECPHSDVDRRETQRTWDWLGGIRFEAYSQCRGCWAAQAVCHSWESVGHSGPQRFHRRGKIWRCQFAGVVRDVVAGVLGLGHAEVVGDWRDEEITKVGMEKKEGLGNWESRKEWMGKKVLIGGIEMSGLGQTFLELGCGRSK